MTITADNAFQLYHFGQSVLVNNQWNVASSVSLADACVLAVFAVHSADTFGILASTSTGVVTDDSWKCSAELAIDWHLASFDDAAWSQAQVLAPNDGSVWAFFAEISSEAKWIWAQDTSRSRAFCRKTLC